MIKEGEITFPHRRYGYADIATQEEAERLSSNQYHRGLIVFMPERNIQQSDVDAHIATEEEVAI